MGKNKLPGGRVTSEAWRNAKEIEVHSVHAWRTLEEKGGLRGQRKRRKVRGRAMS